MTDPRINPADAHLAALQAAAHAAQDAQLRLITSQRKVAERESAKLPSLHELMDARARGDVDAVAQIEEDLRQYEVEAAEARAAASAWLRLAVEAAQRLADLNVPLLEAQLDELEQAFAAVCTELSIAALKVARHRQAIIASIPLTSDPSAWSVPAERPACWNGMRAAIYEALMAAARAAQGEKFNPEPPTEPWSAEEDEE